MPCFKHLLQRHETDPLVAKSFVSTSLERNIFDFVIILDEIFFSIISNLPKVTLLNLLKNIPKLSVQSDADFWKKAFR